MTARLPASALLVLATACAGSLFAQSDDGWTPTVAPRSVDLTQFTAPDDLEVTVWASTPMVFNPTNMDIDHAGRIWVAEGVNYRRHKGRRKGGDRIAVLQDTDGDGKADSSHTFVQEPALVAPLGVAVFDNTIYVSQPPDLLVYTDVNRDLKFDPAVDHREVLLTGFNARNHDHSLHSVTAGPDGKLYFNNGNCGAVFKDRDGKQFNMGSSYRGGGGEWFVDHQGVAGEPSDDGHVWSAGFTARMNEDGTGVEIIGHGYRNSYEQTVTSMGDVFQNDNDDPPASRTSYLLEYGHAGYFTRDHLRHFRTEMRPGQDYGRAHWRQDDPGTMDAGDIYGGGAPTGITFYENGALGGRFAGSLFSCEPTRNTIFGYQPAPKGATFTLDRTVFATTNPSKQFDGADFTGGARRVKGTRTNSPLLFRPSDITVGPDGALYVADWFDARVGGHADLDDSCSGTIYRIAPKGFRPEIPAVDLTTMAGAVTALRSPAINTRHLGFKALKELGDEALPAVSRLLDDPDKFIRARAVWLLPHLGTTGLARCRALLTAGDRDLRLTAFRALRRGGHDVIPIATQLVNDPDPGVRRDVALSLRDLPAGRTKDLFVALARQCDPTDKNAVEAIGLGAANQENEIWAAIREAMAPGDPASWSPAFAKLTWRLWPSDAVRALGSRAWNTSLSAEDRLFALESLAFINHRSAVDAMFTLAGDRSPVQAEAAAWLLKRGTGEWQHFRIGPELKEKGIYDPDRITVQTVTTPAPEARSTLPPVSEILALPGDPVKGKTTAMRCIICHEIDGAGPNFGPYLKGWARGRTPEVIARSIIDPSADIAHGYDGVTVQLKDGGTVHGRALNTLKSDPLIIQSTGGLTQMIPQRKIHKTGPLGRSLMLSADQLQLKAQDIADLVAFLKSYQ
jgi:putative membrane-bound dehydrogenase-like protein